MFFEISKISIRDASRASAIRAHGVVTIGSTDGFLGLRAAASVPRSIDFRRSCCGVMDRGSFRAGNDLHSFVPYRFYAPAKRATRDESNDLGPREDSHIVLFSRCRSDGRLDLHVYIFRGAEVEEEAIYCW